MKKDAGISGWKVIEDNGGGLTLIVENTEGYVFYKHSGYEYCEGSLRADIEALENGSYPGDWDGNEIEGSPVDFRNIYDQYGCGYNVIMDDGIIFITCMGQAGWQELGRWC